VQRVAILILPRACIISAGGARKQTSLVDGNQFTVPSEFAVGGIAALIVFFRHGF